MGWRRWAARGGGGLKALRHWKGGWRGQMEDGMGCPSHTPGLFCRRYRSHRLAPFEGSLSLSHPLSHLCCAPHRLPPLLGSSLSPTPVGRQSSSGQVTQRRRQRVHHLACKPP